MTYEFQSTSNARLILVIILGTIVVTTFTIGSFLLIDSSPFFKSYDDIVILIISVLGVALFWLIGRKFLKQRSTLQFQNGTLIFIRDGKKKEIRISEIESYKYKLVKGVRLTIWTRRNETISIIANDAFCQYEDLENFCSDFDKYINSLKTDKLGEPEIDHSEKLSKIPVEKELPELSRDRLNMTADEESSKKQSERVTARSTDSFRDEIPRRKKSFYEKKYAQPFLIVFTILAIAFVIYVIVDGGNLPAAIIVSAGGLSAMWAGYFNHQKK